MVKASFDVDKISKSIKEKSVSVLNERQYDVECPHCNEKLSISPGKSICPFCNEEIDFTLNITFKD